MFNLKEFLTYVLIKILKCGKTNKDFEKYGVKRNIFQNYFDEKQNRLYLATDSAFVLREFIFDKISSDVEKKEQLFEYFMTFLTDEEKNYIYEHPDNTDELINFTIIKFMREKNNSFNDFTLESILKQENLNKINNVNAMNWKLESQAIRVVPIDIGTQLSDNDVNLITNYLSKYYSRVNLSSRRLKILCKSYISYRINKFLDLVISHTGIVIFVIKEKPQIETDLKYFSIEYCKNRKEHHKRLMLWNHHQSNNIRKIVDNLRDILKNNHANIRKSANNEFEYGGISYIMTISFFKLINNQNQLLNWEDTPRWLKQNIQVLLNPSIIFMEDSMSFYNESSFEPEYLKNIIDKIDYSIQCVDCELRLHVSTYASWAAVVIIGYFEESDVDEYISLEIKLQEKWFYIHCLETLLPTNIFPSDVSLNIQELKLKMYELKLIENQLDHIDDTSLPERIEIVQNAIIETSNIRDVINRYKEKLNFVIEMQLLQNKD